VEGIDSIVTANNSDQRECRTLMLVEQGRVAGVPTGETDIGELLALESARR